MQKIILVGLGFMGGMHAQIFKQLDNAQLVAVVDHREEATRQKLKKLGFDIPVYPRLNLCLESVEADVVDICLPTDLHKETALEAIAAGKSIFCEKPIALTVEDGEAIVKAAREAGITAQVGHCIRFWPEYRAFADFLASGKGGKLRSLTLQRRSALPDYSDENWLHSERRAGGAALDLHIHDTDYVLSLLGQPRSVSAYASFDERGPSHIFTHYDYEDIIVHAEGGWNYPSKWGFEMAFQAVFEKAAIEFDSTASPTLSVTMDDGMRTALPYEQSQSGKSTSGEGNISDLGGYYLELSYFINCLETGRQPETSTLEHAVESLRVTLGEIESARAGKPYVLSGAMANTSSGS